MNRKTGEAAWQGVKPSDLRPVTEADLLKVFAARKRKPQAIEQVAPWVLLAKAPRRK